MIVNLINWVHQIRQRYMVKFFVGVLVLVAAFYSTLFYLLMRLLEERSVSAWESIYWTINRLTTTGELPAHLSYTSPALQLLSVVVQVSGLAFFFGAFPLAILPSLERRLRGMPSDMYQGMRNHIVICGYSPLVESLIDELLTGARPFIVIENDFEVVREIQRKRVPALFGDPTEEAVLQSAAVQAADFVIANREDEEDNAKIVLATTAISQARVFALIDDIDHAHYFRYAGATEVFSPKRSLGNYLAWKATTPWHNELFGASELASHHLIVELPIYPGSPFDGLTLRECRIPERTGAKLVGIWHRGKLELEPGPDSRVTAENVFIAVGKSEQLLQLQRLTRTATVAENGDKRRFVVAGFGDVGRAVKEVLDGQEIPHTIIDPRAKLGTYIRGDATDEQILRHSKIEGASTFIVASHVDRDNVFSTLVARRLNPDLHILARANSSSATDILYRAGADFVFSLSAVAAQLLAEMLMGETAVTLAEGLKVMTVPVDGRLAGRTVKAAKIGEKTGCTLIACITGDDILCANPKPDFRLTAGTVMVVIGTAAQLHQFKRRFLRR